MPSLSKILSIWIQIPFKCHQVWEWDIILCIRCKILINRWWCSTSKRFRISISNTINTPITIQNFYKKSNKKLIRISLKNSQLAPILNTNLFMISTRPRTLSFWTILSTWINKSNCRPRNSRCMKITIKTSSSKIKKSDKWETKWWVQISNRSQMICKGWWTQKITKIWIRWCSSS